MHLLLFGQWNPVVDEALRWPSHDSIKMSLAHLKVFENKHGTFYDVKYDEYRYRDTMRSLVMEFRENLFSNGVERVIYFQKTGRSYNGHHFIYIRYSYQPNPFSPETTSLGKLPMKFANPHFLIWQKKDSIHVKRFDELGIYQTLSFHRNDYSFIFEFLHQDYSTFEFTNSRSAFIDSTYRDSIIKNTTSTNRKRLIDKYYHAYYNGNLPISKFQHDRYILSVKGNNNEFHLYETLLLKEFYPVADTTESIEDSQQFGNDVEHYKINYNLEVFQFCLKFDQLMGGFADAGKLRP
jgi:hypothetical protein